MLETINDFFTRIDLEFLFKFIIIYFAIIWIVVIIRVLRDITTRTNNIFYQIFCVILILITAPIGGILFYLLIRPRKTLNEKFNSEIEENIDILEEIINERKNSKKEKVKNIQNKTEKIEKKLPTKKQKSKIELKKF